MNSAQPHSATWCSSPRLISVITHTWEASSRGKVFIAAQENHSLYSIWICTFYISAPRLSTMWRKSGCLFVHLMQREHQIKKYEAWLSKAPPQECLLLAMIAVFLQKSCNNVVRVGGNLSEDRVHRRVWQIGFWVINPAAPVMPKPLLKSRQRSTFERAFTPGKVQINPAESDCFPLAFYWFPARLIKNKNEASWQSYRHTSVKEDV